MGLLGGAGVGRVGCGGGPPDEAGGHRGVGGFVDEHEAAGDTVRRVRVGHQGHGRFEVGDPDVVGAQLRCVDEGHRSHVQASVDGDDAGGGHPGGVLELVALPGGQGCAGEPAHRGLHLRLRLRSLGRRGDHVATADVEVVGQGHGDRHRGNRGVKRAVERRDLTDRCAAPAWKHRNSVTGPQHPAADHAGVVAPATGSAEHPLHGQAGAVARARSPCSGRGVLEGAQDGGSSVPRRLVRRLDHIVAGKG